jgi:predicted HTH domain antitoxin
MFLDRKGLCKAVSRYVSSRYLFKLNTVSLDLLSELITMNINMFKLNNKL